MKKVVFATILITSFIITGCLKRNETQFWPIEYQNDDLIVIQNAPEGGFYSNLEHVLQYYGKDYSKKEDGTIWISEELYADKDLMWNYTTKASDSVWLQRIGG